MSTLSSTFHIESPCTSRGSCSSAARQLRGLPAPLLPPCVVNVAPQRMPWEELCGTAFKQAGLLCSQARSPCGSGMFQGVLGTPFCALGWLRPISSPRPSSSPQPRCPSLPGGSRAGLAPLHPKLGLESLSTLHQGLGDPSCSGIIEGCLPPLLLVHHRHPTPAIHPSLPQP